MNVLALTAFYLPGFKAGGPVRSLANLVHRLGDEISFRIVTADRDLGDSAAYSGIEANQWQAVGKAEALYAPPVKRPTARILRHLRTAKPDVLYLNSFFNHRVCAGPLSLRACGLLRDVAVLIAPRGEFSPGAMAIRPWKKRPYLAALRAAGMLRDVWWQATSEIERNDIQRVIGHDARILLASNLSDRCDDALLPRKPKQPGKLALAYLSRISPKKNLLGALELLHGLPGEVNFDIWGPIEDAAYWQRCCGKIASLPANVSVAHRGVVEHAAVRSTLASYDALLCSTHGENYGHVIVEAFTAGCPVVISDRTPWRNLQSQQAGWDLPLERPNDFRSALTELAALDEAGHRRLREGAWELGRRITEDAGITEASRTMFYAAARKSFPASLSATQRAA